jgi:Zn-dependent oligopeptidase
VQIKKRPENKCDSFTPQGIYNSFLLSSYRRLKGNIPLLAEIYEKRNEKAKLLGFPHHSGIVVEKQD